jgi:rubredoxin
MSPIETSSANSESDEDMTGPFYDYVINIYKAHGEAIIAALSAQIPAVRFPPDNADSTEDLETAKTFSKIADLIQKHNHAKRLLLQALLMLWNQGTVAAYHSPKFDRAFGNIQIPQYKAGMQCPQCGYIHDPSSGQEAGQNEQPVPDATGNSGGDNLDNSSGQVNCPQCAAGAPQDTALGTPPQQPQQIPMQPSPILDGFKSAPKMRVMIDVYGPLHVKLPYYARTQKDCTYLICSLDQPKSFLKSTYCTDAKGNFDDDLAKKIDANGSEDIGTYERIGRSPSAYSYNLDGDQYLATLKRCWLRSWIFDDMPESQSNERDQLKELFPDGCYIGMIGRVYIESRNESMDDYWTIGQAGLSTYIHSDPIGQPLIPIQEIRNVTVNLTLETIEQAIPSGFADTDTLNFPAYNKHEARPGMIYPVKRKPGEPLNQSFYTQDRATLSKEIPLFVQQLDKDGQFVVGSFPSIYGGPGEGNSRTASEYNMSRQMALQRLSIVWALLNFWWCSLMEKCVHLYVENMIEDERFVQKEKNNYVNVWIRRSEMTGTVGQVEPEGDESFPISIAQKQSLLMSLFQLQSPEINEALFQTENRSIISEAFAMTEFKMPGEDQRIKQMREINDIIANLQPIQPEKDIDDNAVHIDTTRSFLVSDVGLDLKQSNPQAYGTIVQHLEMHIQLQMMMQMPAPGAPAPQGQVPPGQAPNPPKPQGPPNV